MPWNDESGSGKKGPWGAGGGGGNNNSPWNRPGGSGNGGGGGGGGRGGLEEQMRRMQERFKLRGGRGGRGGSGGGRGRGFGPFGFIVIGLVALLAWFSTGIVIVDEGQQAAVFRFGQHQDNKQPGFHVHWPVPIETHSVLPVEEQKRIDIGTNNDESLMLTGDENIVSVKFTVFWKIKTDQPENFVINVEDPETSVKAVAESVMREVVGKSELEPIITDRRDEVQQEVEDQTQRLLDFYQVGIDILEIQIQAAEVPGPVLSDFLDVVNAAQDAAANINTAQRFANQKVPEARGEAERILNEARAYKETRIATARGEADRFSQLLREYRAAPEVTRERIYLETMENVLERSDKILLDSNTNTLPFLPLDRLGTGRTNQQER